jgi:hypothetical protein
MCVKGYFKLGCLLFRIILQISSRTYFTVEAWEEIRICNKL